MPRHLPMAAGAVCVLALFVWFAAPGLTAGFSHDDLMNLYRAWDTGWGKHVYDLILFFMPSDLFRPAGSMFYRAVYTAAGLDPFPYRLACFALLVANLYLAGLVARRLSGSGEVGLLTALGLAFHGHFWPLYVSTGYVYDLLVVFFYCSALLHYLRERDGGPVTGTRPLATNLLLYLLCLNSKEAAVSLPVVILAWEAMAHPPVRAAQWWDGLVCRARLPLLQSVMTAAFIFGRVRAQYSGGGMSAYQPEPSWAAYAAHAYHWTRELLYEPKWLTPGLACSLALALAVGALASRRRELMLATVWAPVAVLPLAFIPQRGLESVSIALIGVALYVAVAVREVTRLMLRLPGRLDPMRSGAVLVAALVLTARTHQRHWPMGLEPFLREGWYIEDVKRAVGDIRPHLRGARHVLLLADPYPGFEWGSLFTVRLVTNDAGIFVHRADRMHQTWTGEQAPPFDRAYVWSDGRFEPCDPAPFQRVKASEIRAAATSPRAFPCSVR